MSRFSFYSIFTSLIIKTYKNMKGLNQVDLQDIVSDKKYLLVVQLYERYGDGGMIPYIGTGTEIIEKLKQIFDWEEGGEDGEDDDWAGFVEERNGDGDDYVEVFLID